jgi:RNA polymerase sigma-70 factor (ECF subfamily)
MAMIMDLATQQAHLATFEAHRGRLFGLAYRMLGSRADAEDVVQEVWIRWHQAQDADIRTPEAWLVTTATRLAIDRLRAVRTAREAYSGPWLPEPLLQTAPPPPDYHAEIASDLSMAFLFVLERLAPEERAAFLLHEVFEASYADIASMLGRTESACRQIVSRARKRVRRDERRHQATDTEKATLLETFRAAMATRDEAALVRLFTPDVTWLADGGGVVHAAPYPIRGVARVVKLVLGLQRIYAGKGATLEPAWLGGEPGLVAHIGDRLAATYAVRAEDGRIAEVYVMLNPAKLSQTERRPVSGA